MGTISDKLTYLNTTKSNIKDSIELMGTTITNQDTFRSYADKIKNQLKTYLANDNIDIVWDNWNKIEEEGTSLTLNNTMEGKMSLILKGNTYQETTTGKNLFDKDNANVFQGFLNYSSVITNSNSATTIYIPCKSNTTYTVQKSASGTNNRFCVFTTVNIPVAGDSALNYVGTRQGADNNTNYTITTPTQANYLCVFIGVDTTTPTINEILSTIQIEENSSTTSYEKYTGGIPAPNPDYPQTISNVTGTNTIKIVGKNLFDISKVERGVSYSYGNSGSVPTSSSSNARATLSPNNAIKVQPNTTYTFNHNSTWRISLGQLTSGKVSLGDSGWKTSSAMPLTITTGATCEYVGFNFSKSDNSTITDNDWNTFINSEIQLEENSTATTYEAYKEQTYPINLGNIELCKIGTYKDRIYKSTGKNLFDGVLELGNFNTNTGEKVQNSNYIINTNLIPVEELANYKISLNGSGIGMYVFEYKSDYSYNLTARKTIDANSYLTTNSGTKYIAFRTIDTNTDTTSKIQVEMGTTITSYEPYGSGKWYLEKNIGKVTLDGSENWNYQSEHPRFIMNLSPRPVNGAMCYAITYIKGQTSSAGSNNTMSVASGTGYSQLLIHDERFTTKNDYNNWLSNNNVEVYYPLETPTTTEITDTTLVSQLDALNNARSYNVQTNISQSNDNEPATINATALENI